MIVITVLAIVAVPVCVYLVGASFLEHHKATLSYLERTATVGGKPVALIHQETELQAAQAKEAAELQRSMMDRLRDRNREALGS